MTEVRRRKWRLGEACYIVSMSLIPGCVSMQVMPAIVVNAAAPLAQACLPSGKVGPIFEKGQPFSTEEDARASLEDLAKDILAASTHTPLVGTRPQWKVPGGWPSIGDTIYFADWKAKEVVEATVGFLSLEDGHCQIGYDSSPGNPEASNVELTEWWASKNEALQATRHRVGGDLSFVSKEELARRTDNRINDVWDQTAKVA